MCHFLQQQEERTRSSSAVWQFCCFFVVVAVVVLLVLCHWKYEKCRGEETTEEIADCFHCANRRCFLFFLQRDEKQREVLPWHRIALSHVVAPALRFCFCFGFPSFLPSFFASFRAAIHNKTTTHSLGEWERKKNSQRIPWHVSTRVFVWRGTHVEQQKQQRQHQNEGNMAVRGYRKAGQGWAKQGDRLCIP